MGRGRKGILDWAEASKYKSINDGDDVFVEW